MDPNSIQAMVLGLVVRHALTGLAGTLVTLGWIGNGDQASFVTMGTGIAIGAAGVAWSWWQKTGHASALATLDKIRRGQISKSSGGVGP
jgi:hypothetical protein